MRLTGCNVLNGKFKLETKTLYIENGRIAEKVSLMT